MPAASASACSSGSRCQRSCTAPIRNGRRRGGRVRAGEVCGPSDVISAAALSLYDHQSCIRPLARLRAFRSVRCPPMSATLDSTPAADGYRMPPSSSPMPAAGWRGPSGRTTGGSAPSRRRRRSRPSPRRSPSPSRSRWPCPMRSSRTAARALALGSCRRDVIRRCVDARHRPDVRRRRPRRQARSRLALQRVGRAARRPLLPVGPRRARRREGARDRTAPIATGRRSCSRAARSTSTARARCSSPKSAC